MATSEPLPQRPTHKSRRLRTMKAKADGHVTIITCIPLPTYFHYGGVPHKERAPNRVMVAVLSTTSSEWVPAAAPVLALLYLHILFLSFLPLSPLYTHVHSLRKCFYSCDIHHYTIIHHYDIHMKT